MAFIIAHILYTFTYHLSDPGFSLAKDGGYAEIFQYLKLVGITVLIAALAKAKRAPVYFLWTSILAFILLDDSLLIHEQVGEWMADIWNLPALFGAKGYHFGEFLFFFLLGVFFIAALSITYQRSDRRARIFSQDLIIYLGGLAVFAVILDLIQEMLSDPFLYATLGTIEDGGETVLISFLTGFVFVRTWQALRWGERERASLQTLTHSLMLFTGCVIFFGIIQFSTPGFAGNDGYYHAKMGLLIRQEGIQPSAPRLPLTILNESSFYDHHLLYHVYLALFATVDPVVDGGLNLLQRVKFASALLPALAFLAVWWSLRQLGVRWPTLWALGLLGISAAFLYRMSMPRVQAASLLVLVLALNWLIRERFLWLLPLGFAYAWLFDGFPLLLVLSGAYFIAAFFLERRPVWAALVYPGTGVLLGIVINPYFPENLVFIRQHVLPKIGSLTTPVGSEWYPYTFTDLIRSSGLAFGLLLLTLVALGLRRETWDRGTLTALLVTVLFGVMLVKSRRFVEYFPPFALITTALIVNPWLESWQRHPSRLQRWLPYGCVLVLILPIVFTLSAARTYMADSLPADQYRSATLWLKAYGQPGSRVFQTDWDDFPRLFFYDSANEYTVGLDPTFMQLFDAGLYEEWVKITRGELLQPGDALRNHFDTDYIFSDLDHREAIQVLAEDPQVQEIYRDEYAVIFKLLTSQ